MNKSNVLSWDRIISNSNSSTPAPLIAVPLLSDGLQNAFDTIQVAHAGPSTGPVDDDRPLESVRILGRQLDDARERVRRRVQRRRGWVRGKEDGERGRRGIRVWEVGEDGGQLIGSGWSRVDHLQIEFERS